MNHTRTIDVEVMIEPTRPSCKHLHTSGFGVVFLLTLNQNCTEGGKKKKKKPHKNQHYLRAPLLIAKDLLLFTLKNITSLRQNSDQMKLVYTRLLKIVKRWGLLM